MQTKQYKLNNATMRNTFILILLTLLSIIANNLAAQTTKPTKVTVVNTSTSEHHRIPSIVKLANGNLMAFYDNRYSHGADVGTGSQKADIEAKISKDNGATWGETMTILEGTGKANDGYKASYGEAATVVDRETGELLLMCTAGANSSYVKTIATENGTKWADPVDITSQITSLRNDFNTAFVTSGHICQSSRIKVGSHYRIYAAIASFYTFKVLVIYSDDFGESWHCLGSNTEKPNIYGSESKLEELPNGDVLLSCRGAYGYQNGRWYNVFTYSNQKTASGSWGTITQSNYSNSNNTQAIGSTADGEVLLVPAKDSNGNVTWILLQSADKDARQQLWFNYKELDKVEDFTPNDFKEGWSHKQIATDAAYSTMVLDQNNNIAFLYEANCLNSKSYDIVFQSMSLSYITDGKYTFDSGRGDATEYLARPLFSANEGEYSNEISVEITCATNGATIYYTTDGSEPTTASNKYTGAISISETTMLKAIAVKGELQSEVATATYTIIEKTEEMEANVKPEDGGVYVIYALSGNWAGKYLYIYNNNGTLAGNLLSAPKDYNTYTNYLWVCSKASDGTYYFSTLDGQGYLGHKVSNGDYDPTYVTDFNEALRITDFIRTASNTTMTGYALKFNRQSSTSDAYVSVDRNGTFGRYSKLYNTESTTYTHTTDFVFNKVPYVKGGTGCGTLSEPMHHGFNVKFARNDDSYNVAGTGEGYNSYATLNLPFTVSLPDGVKAYRIKSLSKKVNTAVDIEEYAGTVIARETAVLLQTSGAKGDGMPTKTISFKPTTAKENTEDTGLAGTLGRQVFANYNESTGDSNGTIYYLLGKKDGHVAFYYLAANKSGEMAIANNKAYYKYTVGSGAKPAMLTFNLDGTPTAIKGVTDNGCGQSGTWYDLTGRKVKNPSHGIYIRNGKKVVLP